MGLQSLQRQLRKAARRGRRGSHLPVVCAIANSDPNRKPNTERNSDSDANFKRIAFCNAYAYRDQHSNADRDQHTDSHCHQHADRCSNKHSNPDQGTHSDADANSYHETDRDPDHGSDGDADSDAGRARPIVPEGQARAIQLR